MAPKKKAKGNSSAEKRIDPEDGQSYTYEDMAEYYSGTYQKAIIKAYWENCKPVAVAAPKPKAKAKAKKAPKPPRVVKVGTQFPDVELHFGFPPETVNMLERLKDKKVIILGLPGAFTPCGSTKQVPEYLKRQDELKAKGVDEIIVYCVNDGAVMKGWAKDQGVDGSMITFMADPQSKLTRKLGMALRHPGVMGVLGNPRCKRFVLVVDNCEVKAVEISEAEGDPAGDNEPDGPITAKTRVDNVLTLL